jgi:hypothetical protein
MKDLKQWVCWRSEARQRDAKPTKVPYSPASGARARSDDPDTWGTLAEAEKAAEKVGYDGIGFVFTARDPFCGVDLDACVDPETGEIEPWAREILHELDSYAEFSPSGIGLHVIVRAKLPPGGNRRNRTEMYDRGRFFTVTRRRLPGTSHRVEERQGEIEALHARLFPPEEQHAPTNAPAKNEAAASECLTDAEVLRRAMSSRNGQRFAKLWAGDRSGYASDSEADLALCSMLAFWVKADRERIASLFSSSGLNRQKWNREDYRRRTISRAIEGTTSFYAPGRDGQESSRNADPPDPEPVGFAGAARGPTSALPQAPGFPVEAMPAPCRRLVEESTASLGCAPELVALPMLAVLSSAIGTSRIVEVKGGWREWAALFVAVVASPGAMKTPAAKVAKRPAFARQRDLGGAYGEEKEEWKREMREWEVEKRDAQKAGEPAPEEPDAPSMSRCLASDTTVEALVSILEENPRGLLVHKDELAGWVRGMDQYKGGKGSDRQHWLSFWSGDEVVVDRKSRQGEPIIVAKPFVSLFGGIQPSMLGELGAGAEDGLMDRFLFCYPAPRHVRFTEDEVSEDAEQEYAALYGRLADLRLATDEHGDPNPRPLKLTRRARDLFAAIVDSMGAEVLEPGFPSRLEGVWSKLRGYLARLSLVLAVCRCASGGVTEERIEQGDVQAASQLLGYFRAHATRVYAELGPADPTDLLAVELRELLDEAGGTWEGSATDLHKVLEERESAHLPKRPEELSKRVLHIGERSPALETAQGWRKVGGRKGNSRRVLRLALADKVHEDAVVTVDPADDYPPGDNGTNGNNGVSEHSSAGRDDGNNGNNGDSSRARDRGHDPNVDLPAPNDGRRRFTI